MSFYEKQQLRNTDNNNTRTTRHRGLCDRAVDTRQLLTPFNTSRRRAPCPRMLHEMSGPHGAPPAGAALLPEPPPVRAPDDTVDDTLWLGALPRGCAAAEVLALLDEAREGVFHAFHREEGVLELRETL